MAKGTDYYYPDEFVMDGVMYEPGTPEKDLIYIRDQLEFQEDDILLTCYPKCGTTWTQEIIWALHHGPESIDKRDKPLDEVFPWIEWNNYGLNGLQLMEQLPRPRFLKTHLYSGFFERQLEGEAVCPKIIVLLRNPKDALVSYYHFHKLWPDSYQYPGNWHDFFQLCKEKRVLYGDYFDCVLSWWKYKDHPNVFFVKYEDMKRDIHSAIQQIGNFLDRPVSGNKLDAIVEETSFTKMKSRPLDKIFKPGFFDPNAAFFRKGEVGSYQADFTEEQNDYIDDMQHVKFHGTGITFEV